MDAVVVFLVRLAICTLGSQTLGSFLYLIVQTETILKHRLHNDSAILRD